MSDLVPAPPSGTALVVDSSQLYVVFKVGDVDYAPPASDVLQMESFAGATAVPGAPAFVRGIIQLRGRVVPVVDLRLRFGLDAIEPTLASRVVVAERAGRAVALLADTAREVVRIDASQEKPPPQLVDSGGFVRAVVQLPQTGPFALDFAKVIGEETIDV